MANRRTSPPNVSESTRVTTVVPAACMDHRSLITPRVCSARSSARRSAAASATEDRRSPTAGLPTSKARGEHPSSRSAPPTVHRADHAAHPGPTTDVSSPFSLSTLLLAARAPAPDATGYGPHRRRRWHRRRPEITPHPRCAQPRCSACNRCRPLALGSHPPVSVRPDRRRSTARRSRPGARHAGNILHHRLAAAPGSG